MSNIAPIYQAVDFIEDHLKEPITVADVADAVSYSLYHFCRMFNRATHHTPYDYLMRRRLSESARQLLEADRRIIEIALDYQFNSPETYSRAFKCMFGTQPNQWRKQGKKDERFLMARMTLQHIKHINKGEYLRPVLIEKGAFQVAGVMTLVREDEGAIPELWQILAQELARIENAGKPGDYYGIVCYPEDWDDHGFFYMAGTEIEDVDQASPALVVKTIPPLKWARFVHRGPVRDRQLTLDYIYQTWLPKSGKKLSGSLEIEYCRHDLGYSDHEEAEREVLIPIQ